MHWTRNNEREKVKWIKISEFSTTMNSVIAFDVYVLRFMSFFLFKWIVSVFIISAIHLDSIDSFYYYFVVNFLLWIRKFAVKKDVFCCRCRCRCRLSNYPIVSFVLFPNVIRKSLRWIKNKIKIYCERRFDYVARNHIIDQTIYTRTQPLPL